MKTFCWVLGLLAVWRLWQSSALAAEEARSIAIGSVGFFHPWIGDRYVDPTYKEKLNAARYQIGKLEYGEVSWEKLRPFNVLVLQWAPNEGDTNGNAVYDQKLPLFERYVREGGGLLVTCENAYATYKSVNRLLKAFGAEIVNEAIIDDRNSLQQKSYLQYFFTKTTNLNRSSTLVAGMESFTYPLTHSLSEGYGTMPLRLSSEWQTVISAEESAHSSKGTFGSAPAIVAAREYGQGRIVAMPMHTTFFFNAGYHRIWEGITMEQGNGYRFLDNTYRWLAAPSLKSGIFGGYRETTQAERKPVSLPPEAVNSTDLYTQLLVAGQRQPVTKIVHQRENFTDFTGLIGAHTAYSSGQGTVRDYAAKAKAKGHSFIVFTEDLALMDEGKWQRLVADCKESSGDTFLALPGIEYEDVGGNRYVCFNMPRWPNREWLDESGKKVQNTPGLYFGLDWPPLYVIEPTRNPTRPWYLKFYSGMEVLSYPRDAQTPIEDLSEYLQVQANDYNLIPIAGHRLYSPEEVAKAGGYLTHALAKNVAGIPPCFKYFWYAQRHSYVSDGPRIEEFAIENGRGAAREEEWQLHIDVSSVKTITDVIVYDRKEVFYHFRPGQRRFTQVLRGYHDKQRHLTMVVVDSEGRRAISSTAYTSDLRQSIYMCTDLQNTLNCMSFLDHGKLTVCGVVGNYVTGWDSLSPGILVTEGEIMPPGLDYVVKGFGGGVSPVAYTPEAAEGAIAQRDMVFASGDVNMLDNVFTSKLLPGSVIAPTECADSRARFICFTPRPYSYNMMVIETETTFKKDFTFATRSGPEFVKLRVGGPEESFANYTYIAPDGRKVSRKRVPRSTSVPRGLLAKGGYVALWPDFYGSVAVYPLVDKQYSFTLNGANVEIGDEMGGRSVKAGTKVRDSFLVVRGKFGESDDAGFDRLRDLYGLDGSAAYSIALDRGQVMSIPLVPVVKAEGHRVSGKITAAELPNDLGVIVDGLNENWDAGLYDRASGKVRRIGVFEGRGYFTADLSNPLDFVAGNLLIADRPEVRLHLFLSEEGKAEVEVHNPTNKPMVVTVRGNPQIAMLESIREKVALDPGEVRTIRPPVRPSRVT